MYTFAASWKPECSRKKCSAPFKHTREQRVNFSICKSCQKTWHPNCAPNGNCCESSNILQLTAQTDSKGNYHHCKSTLTLPQHVNVPAKGKVDLDRSFCMPSLPAQKQVSDDEMNSLSKVMGGAFVATVTTSMAVIPTTTVTASTATTPRPSTHASNPTFSAIVSGVTPVADNSQSPAPSSAAAVATALSNIEPDDALYPIAQAMKLFVSANEAKLNTISDSIANLHSSNNEYHARTAALESEVGNLKVTDSLLQRKSADALAAARAAEQGCVSDQIVVTGLPSADLSSVRDAFAIIGDKLGIEIGSDAIIDVRSRKTSPSADPRVPATQPASASVDVDHTPRHGEIFVTLTFAELRTIILRRSAELRNLKSTDLGFDCDKPENIKFFEVLVGHRQNQFMRIRKEAQKLGVTVWHRNGTFFGRRNQGAKPVKIYEVADLHRISD